MRVAQELASQPVRKSCRIHQPPGPSLRTRSPRRLRARLTSPTDRALRRLVQKVRRERGQLTLYVGYALRVRKVIARDREETRLEPVLLYPIEDLDATTPPEVLRPAIGSSYSSTSKFSKTCPPSTVAT